MADGIEIEHQPLHSRFVLETEGLHAELTYQQNATTIVFNHTEVPAELQHRGHANRLAEAALGYAREQNLRVVPQCRFMAVYIDRHKQWQDLLKTPGESHAPRPMTGGTR